ncbi:MAG: exodeoxyribonuclease VII small subunit [Cyclobacteriaceae bacterium]|nr:exodeoxyribonuclease VII small subunit [Cyclobacteriaceae bacterium]
MKAEEITYKEALAKIEEIVSKVENGEPDIDELAGMVKTATELIRYCKEKLRQTEDDLNKILEEPE